MLFRSADRIPVLAADDPRIGAARDRDREVVLLGAVDAIGPVIVDRHVIELCGRLILLLGPGPAAIDGDGCAAVVAVDQSLRIARIDPQRMMIAVRGGQQLEILAAIGRAERAGVQDVYGVERDGVRKDVRVVPGALPEAVVGVDPGPGVAAIVGAEDAAFLRLDGRVEIGRASCRERV